MFTSSMNELFAKLTTVQSEDVTIRTRMSGVQGSSRGAELSSRFGSSSNPAELAVAILSINTKEMKQTSFLDIVSPPSERVTLCNRDFPHIPLK
jgi:hypothetical protein